MLCEWEPPRIAMHEKAVIGLYTGHEDEHEKSPREIYPGFPLRLFTVIRTLGVPDSRYRGLDDDHEQLDNQVRVVLSSYTCSARHPAVSPGALN